MKKTYKTTFEIEAEQFDGSEEMAKEYEMMMSPAGVYYVNAFDGVKAIREGDWLISNGEDIAIVDDEYFKEHYELVEDDEQTDNLTKVVDEFKEREAELSNILATLALNMRDIKDKLEEINIELHDQEKIRHNEKVAQSSAYGDFIDKLTDMLKNNHLL